MVESSTAGNALSLKLLDEVSMLPAEGLGKITNAAELAARVEAEVGEGTRNNNALNLKSKKIEKKRGKKNDKKPQRICTSIGNKAV